jgi:hypothetical protein
MFMYNLDDYINLMKKMKDEHVFYWWFVNVHYMFDEMLVVFTYEYRLMFFKSAPN